MTTQQED